MKIIYYVIFAVIGAVALFPVVSIVFYGAVPVGINYSYFENCEDCELYGCTDDEVYHRGICMTPEAKEKSESVEVTIEPELDSKTLECYALFHCNAQTQNFEEYINSYRYGFTVKSMCQFSNVTVNDGCVDITFSNDSRMISCDLGK